MRGVATCPAALLLAGTALAHTGAACPTGPVRIIVPFAAKSAPDGYTQLALSNAHSVNQTLIPSKPLVLLRDFVPVGPTNDSEPVLVARPALKAGTLAEGIAQARAQPGRLNDASSGPGTPYHMAGKRFKRMAGICLVPIPQRPSRYDSNLCNRGQSGS